MADVNQPVKKQRESHDLLTSERCEVEKIERASDAIRRSISRSATWIHVRP